MEEKEIFFTMLKAMGFPNQRNVDAESIIAGFDVLFLFMGFYIE